MVSGGKIGTQVELDPRGPLRPDPRAVRPGGPVSGANPRRFPASRWPEPVKKAIRTLEAAGWECWAVGGCVRDAAMGLAPPRLGPRLLRPAGSGHRRLPGVQRQPDGDAPRHRRRPPWTARCWRLRPSAGKGAIPISATPTGHLHRQPAGGPLPPGFHRQCDGPPPFPRLLRPVRRPVRLKGAPPSGGGQPVERMQEDPLRILRGLRFIARLGLAPDRETAAAFRSCCPMLGRISRERVYAGTDRDALRGKRCWRRCWVSPRCWPPPYRSWPRSSASTSTPPTTSTTSGATPPTPSPPSRQSRCCAG